MSICLVGLSSSFTYHNQCHDFSRSRSLSLFGWCSAVDVTGLLAITDPFFIFHWFCLVFLHTWFQSHQLRVVYLTHCFPSNVPVGDCLFVCDVHVLCWCATGFVPTCYFVHLSCFGVLSVFFKQLRLCHVRPPAPDFPATNTHPLQSIPRLSNFHYFLGIFIMFTYNSLLARVINVCTFISIEIGETDYCE